MMSSTKKTTLILIIRAKSQPYKNRMIWIWMHSILWTDQYDLFRDNTNYQQQWKQIIGKKKYLLLNFGYKLLC